MAGNIKGITIELNGDTTMKADVLRRSEQFDKLIEEYRDRQFDNELLDNIRVFQLHKAEKRDTGCYLVQDAIDHCEKVVKENDE